jgi:hypothetical protein
MGESADPPQKTFTVAEADALLPAVISLLEQLQQLERQIVQANQQIEAVMHKVSQGNGFSMEALQQQIDALTKHQLQLIDAFQAALTQLEATGCVVKDVATGLVDFYGERSGEIVFLCWKQGEERIRFWHSLEGGYAGREPIE